MLAEISDEWGWTRPSVEVGRLALIVSVVSCAPSSDDRGQFLWEYWVGIGGDAIADLTSHPDYPDNPSGRRLFGRLETPRQFEDHYGARLRGRNWRRASNRVLYLDVTASVRGSYPRFGPSQRSTSSIDIDLRFA